MRDAEEPCSKRVFVSPPEPPTYQRLGRLQKGIGYNVLGALLVVQMMKYIRIESGEIEVVQVLESQRVVSRRLYPDSFLVYIIHEFSINLSTGIHIVCRDH